MNRAEYRRKAKQEAKKNRVYTVTQVELERMVKRAAFEMLTNGMRQFRDYELKIIRDSVRKIVSLYQAIWRNVLADMGLLTRENAEELICRTTDKWEKVDNLVMNRNLHELQKFADEEGADVDTFLELEERKPVEELAEIYLDLDDEDMPSE